MGSNACRRKFKDWRSTNTSSQPANVPEGRSKETGRGRNTSKTKADDGDAEDEPVTKRTRGRAKSTASAPPKRK